MLFLRYEIKQKHVGYLFDLKWNKNGCYHLTWNQTKRILSPQPVKNVVIAPQLEMKQKWMLSLDLKSNKKDTITSTCKKFCNCPPTWNETKMDVITWLEIKQKGYYHLNL